MGSEWPFRYELTIDKLLSTTLVRSPEKEIVYRDVRRYTYREFDERIRRLASGFSSLGLERGSRIGVIDWNTLHYLELMYAVPIHGSALHYINLRLAPEEILYTIRYVEDDALIVRDEFLPLVEKMADRIGFVKHWIVVNDTGELPDSKLKPLHHIEDVVKAGDPGFKPEGLKEDMQAAIYFTSGTTGLPKAVHFKHRQIVLQAIINTLVTTAYPAPTRISSLDVIMHIPPFFHGMGWMMPYLAGLIGLKQVLPGRYDATVMLELIKREGVTFAAGVPVFLRMLLWHPEVDKYRDALKGFKFLIDGEHPPRVLFEQARKYGIEMIEAFGMSEGVGFTFAIPRDDMIGRPWEELVEYYNTAGIPAPFVQVKIVDAEGREVPRDFKTMGEVLIKSPGLTEGYWKDEERTKASWTEDGWFKTGDIGVWNEKGYILIVDRAKDVIKSGGEWISSLRLEDLISKHPAVAEVAVIAARSRKWSERPLAVVVLKEEYRGKVKEEDLREYLMKEYVDKGLIPKWWVPDKFIFTDALPRTSVGKTNKRALRDKYKDIELP
ncbi:MAG: long-chain-fatty-acid--CoA ligase [Desulfurococcales archaeon]|nr:long-chain-fatty-acid--CoA ligase [Desulfurococcales archaeon]